MMHMPIARVAPALPLLSPGFVKKAPDRNRLLTARQLTAQHTRNLCDRDSLVTRLRTGATVIMAAYFMRGTGHPAASGTRRTISADEHQLEYLTAS
jgi:hypothetical protein